MRRQLIALLFVTACRPDVCMADANTPVSTSSALEEAADTTGMVSITAGSQMVSSFPDREQSFVSVFWELELAVESGGNISISALEIVFSRSLEVCERTSIATEQTIDAILSGDDSGRLFVVDKRSFLSLRGVTLAHGRCSGCSGGAIFVCTGGELLLHSVRITANHASAGGAIYAFGSVVVATDCTMTSNSAAKDGGAIIVEGGDSSLA